MDLQLHRLQTQMDILAVKDLSEGEVCGMVRLLVSCAC